MKATRVLQSAAEHPGASQEAYFLYNMAIVSEHLLIQAGRRNAFAEHGSLVIQLFHGNTFLGLSFVCRDSAHGYDIAVGAQ